MGVGIFVVRMMMQPQSLHVTSRLFLSARAHQETFEATLTGTCLLSIDSRGTVASVASAVLSTNEYRTHCTAILLPRALKTDAK